MMPRSLPAMAALAGALLLLAACADPAPLRYHALGGESGPRPAGAARMLVEILPVTVPERLNRQEVVLTDAQGGIDVRGDDRWAAPLSDEVRQMIADTLWRDLSAADIYQAPLPAGALSRPHYRLAVRVERLEGRPGGTAVVSMAWTLRRLPNGPAAVCLAEAARPVAGADVAQVARAASEAVGALAGGIAASLDALDRGEAAVCPAGAS